MCYIFKARKRQLLIVDDNQLQILVGCLLGDGYITKRGAIQIEQGSRQKDYLLWKYEQLKSLVSVKPSRVTRTNKKNGKTTYSYRFFLRQFFRVWREKMYVNGKKIVPVDLIDIATPLSLAIWYMDDGSLGDHSYLIISTDGFDNESQERIVRVLKSKWDINARIVDKKNGDKLYKRLVIGSHNLVKFFSLVRPHIIPSMQYKISDPVTTQSIKRRSRDLQIG